MDDNHIVTENNLANVNHDHENQQQENILNNVERDLQNGTQRRNEGARNNLNPRDRLFYALFMKIGQLYARLVPKKLRILLEIVVLLKGLLLFSFLSYLHFSFGKVPMNCLNSTIGSWPRDGILRVQIQPEYNLEKQLPRFYSPRQNIVLFHPCHNEKKISPKLCSSLSKDLESYYKYYDKGYALKNQCYRMNLSDFMHQEGLLFWKNYRNFEYIFSDRRGNLFKGFKPGEIIKEDRLIAFYEKYLSSSGVEFKQIRSDEKSEIGWRLATIDDCLRNMKQLKNFLDQIETSEWALLLLKDGVVKGRGYHYVISEGDTNAGFKLMIKPERHYVFEYAQEFGFLRISQEARNRLNIPVKTISFDPNKEKCFGDTFSRFILKYFLGYDDVLMNSIKKIADAENNTGYMLNVYTGDHYKFVSWGMGRSSYFVSLLLMFLFTISISTLLRYCHQQVFFFIIHLLQMMDMNVVLAFPIAPLFTVILSLVGMETIMSEYFNDTTTSFYIILIVWAVDQFDTICCHTEISQKYWLRFFYLYHFIFYSYHYRFNGQYSSIALAATWFLIQHSMLYFLHNYELPAIENGTNNGRRDEDAYLDEAVQMIVEGIEMVAGQQNNLNQQEVANHENENTANDPNQVVNSNEYNNEEERAAEPQEPLDYMVHRVILFAADSSFLQIFRAFIRLILEHINIDRRNSSLDQLTEQPSASVTNEAEELANERTEMHLDARNDELNEPDGYTQMMTIENSENLRDFENVELPPNQSLDDECPSSDCDCYLQIFDVDLPDLINENESQMLIPSAPVLSEHATLSSQCPDGSQLDSSVADECDAHCQNFMNTSSNDENSIELLPGDLFNNKLEKDEDNALVHR